MRASCDHVDSGSAVSDGRGKFMVNSKATSEYVISLTITMTSLLTLDHTTLFFYTLSLSSQHHTTSVEHWRSAVDTNIHPGSNATCSAPPAPSLTHTSTCSSAKSSSKCQFDAIIDLSGPTLKKLRNCSPRTVANAIANSKVKVAINYDNDYGDLCRGSHSDKDEKDFSEAVAAHLSPFKNGAWATNSVSIFDYI